MVVIGSTIIETVACLFFDFVCSSIRLPCVEWLLLARVDAYHNYDAIRQVWKFRPSLAFSAAFAPSCIKRHECVWPTLNLCVGLAWSEIDRTGGIRILYKQHMPNTSDAYWCNLRYPASLILKSLSDRARAYHAKRKESCLIRYSLLNSIWTLQVMRNGATETTWLFLLASGLTWLLPVCHRWLPRKMNSARVRRKSLPVQVGAIQFPILRAEMSRWRAVQSHLCWSNCTAQRFLIFLVAMYTRIFEWAGLLMNSRIDKPTIQIECWPLSQCFRYDTASMDKQVAQRARMYEV